MAFRRLANIGARLQRRRMALVGCGGSPPFASACRSVTRPVSSATATLTFELRGDGSAAITPSPRFLRILDQIPGNTHIGVLMRRTVTLRSLSLRSRDRVCAPGFRFRCEPSRRRSSAEPKRRAVRPRGRSDSTICFTGPTPAGGIDRRSKPRATRAKASSGRPAISPQTLTGVPVSAQARWICLQRPKRRRRQRVVAVGHPRVPAVGGEQILHQVVGPDADEVGHRQQRVQVPDQRRRLDHRARRQPRRRRPAAALGPGDLDVDQRAGGAELVHVGDQREHDPQRPALAPPRSAPAAAGAAAPGGPGPCGSPASPAPDCPPARPPCTAAPCRRRGPGCGRSPAGRPPRPSPADRARSGR